MRLIELDLALVDTAFIRLTPQRFYGRLTIEENSKRKFRNYHGGDWCRIAQELDLGFFIYLVKNKLKVVNVPLFETKRKPMLYDMNVFENSFWGMYARAFVGRERVKF
ncbi:unnamed protein product [marine sediment metagenome]|uniref:Uncharacterized protein n=1 Tax=marine sediment metagenome TaxID=412755 RepID=X0WTV4_9ZZZZ